MKVELINTTNIPGLDSETSLVYMARVSSSKSDEDKHKNPEKLIKYLIKHKHWSPFEMIHATFYIETSIDISRQLTRHHSFSFQEFSLRYNDSELPPDYYESPQLRKTGANNRQSSVEMVVDNDYINIYTSMEYQLIRAINEYNSMLKQGIASETARGVLPLCTKTKLFMCGSLRSWIHWLEARDTEEAQKEHRDIAIAIKEIMIEQFPITMSCING